MDATPGDREIRCARGRWLYFIIDSTAGEIGKSVQGRFGCGPACLQFAPGDKRDCKRGQVKNALSSHFPIVLYDRNVGWDFLHETDETVGGPEIQAEGIGDLNPVG